MPITDAQFVAWMRDDSARRAVLAEINYHDGSSEKTAYISTNGFVSAPTDTPANTPYPERIASVPTIRASADDLTWGPILIRNLGGEIDNWLDWGWGRRAVKIGLGDPSWPRSDFRFIEGLTARQGITAPNRDALQIIFHDKTSVLDAPVQEDVLADDTPIPLCFGRPFNVQPVFVGEDASGAHYIVHEGALTAIPSIRSGGVAVAGGSITLDLAGGGFAINPAPTGQVTCDPQNDTYATAADITEYLLTQKAGLTAGDIDTTSFSDFDTAHPQVLGVYIKDRANLREVIPSVLSGVQGVLSPNIAGKFYLWQYGPPAGETPILELNSSDVPRGGLTLRQMIRPLVDIRLGWRQNFAVQDEDALFGAVSTDNRQLYGREWTRAQHTQTLARYAESLTALEVDTPLTVQTDADTEAQRRLVDRDRPQKAFSLSAYLDPVLRLGEVVTVSLERYGLDEGLDLRVVGYEWDIVRGRGKYSLLGITGLEFLLMESGDYILKEDGGRLILSG